jgi:glycosyltransferase involved in cell wall biosynthesis
MGVSWLADDDSRDGRPGREMTPETGPECSSPERRILRVFSRLNVGGPSVQVVLLSGRLRARGYRTRLFVGEEGPREGNLLDLAAREGVECERLPGLSREIRPFADSRSLAALIRVVRVFRPDIVHTHTAKAGVIGRLAARLGGVPIVVHTYHGHVLDGYFGPVRSWLFRQIERAFAKVTDCLIVVSDAVRQDLLEKRIGGELSYRVVPLGLDLEDLAREPPPRGGLRREAGLPDGVPLVGMVGRLVPIKGVPTFLAAARIVRQTVPGAHFALVGDGEERERLESLCETLGLGAAVSFLGWRRDLHRVYGDLDVVVNASLNEGTPVALIEAMAAARPVVATRVGGTGELLGQGARGRLVDAADAPALAAAIMETLREPEEARLRALRGRDYVLKTHSVERLLGDIDALYRELLESRRAAA